MDTVDLVNLSPLARMMLLGVLIAAVPMVWVAWRSRRGTVAQRLASLTTLTLFLTFDLVLFGAFTRLTDSGLGCPDWPGCYGMVSPVGARDAIAAAQAAMPTGPVTFSKAWIEMIHRYLATGVGVLIVVLAWVSWRERRRLQLSVAWPLVTLVWVCLQGAFGALTVTMKLFPAIVTLHLLGGLGLLALLRVQAVRYQQVHPGWQAPVAAQALRPWLWALFGLVGLQIALGGWVSTNYAVLACRDFPTCQGSWWPAMDLARGFELWRPLGLQGSGEALPFAALTAIHYVHRLVAYGVLAALLWVGWRLYRAGDGGRARWLWALGAWQLFTGLSNVVLEWPLVAAVAHTGGAAGLVIVLTGWLAQTHGAPTHAAAPARLFTPLSPKA